MGDSDQARLARPDMLLRRSTLFFPGLRAAFLIFRNDCPVLPNLNKGKEKTGYFCGNYLKKNNVVLNCVKLSVESEKLEGMENGT